MVEVVAEETFLIQGQLAAVGSVYCWLASVPNWEPASSKS